MTAPEPRVGVLAARTFRIWDGYLMPITTNAPDTWRTRHAIATCHKMSGGREPELAPHESPAEGCTCGIYSFRTAQEVATQYAVRARTVLGVIEPAGYAFEGDLGWKSERATLLAVWAYGATERAALIRRYPNVIFYAELDQLLHDWPTVDDGGFEAYRNALLLAQQGTHGAAWAATSLPAKVQP